MTSATLQDGTSLPAQWRQEAAVLRRRGAAAQAEALESCAVELDAWEQAHALERLTLEEAERESGYTYSALEKMVRRGELTNVGEKGRPRVRRGELPRKARRDRPDLADQVLDRRGGPRLDVGR
ncbi:MAG: hypothetical protein ACREL3_07090 [Gemmatimonadales bacterium]